MGARRYLTQRQAARFIGRLSRNLCSQGETWRTLAKKTRVSERMLRRYKSGDCRMTVHRAQRIAAIAGVTRPVADTPRKNLVRRLRASLRFVLPSFEDFLKTSGLVYQLVTPVMGAQATLLVGFHGKTPVACISSVRPESFDTLTLRVWVADRKWRYILQEPSVAGRDPTTLLEGELTPWSLSRAVEGVRKVLDRRRKPVKAPFT